MNDIIISEKKIKKNAFCFDLSLETVIMKDTVEEIDDCAFFKCCSLSNIKFSKNIYRIGTNAFY